MDFGNQVGARLEASWLEKSMENRSKKAWAFQYRFRDVPRGSRTRNIDFSLVSKGFGRREIGLPSLNNRALLLRTEIGLPSLTNRSLLLRAEIGLPPLNNRTLL